MDQLKPSPPNSMPLTPIGFLDRAATIFADCPSIVYNSTTYTWSETYRRCLQMASSLSSSGIRRGDVVSVVAPNIPAMYELHFAVPMAGAVLNTINMRLDARTISVILHHAQSKLVFVDHQSEIVVVEALSLLPPESERPLLVFIGEGDRTAVPSSFFASYEAMISNGDSNFDWVKPESEYDPAVLNYTSGTTSSPKAVVQSHRAVFIMTMGSLLEWSVQKESVYLWTLPMFHCNGWSFTWGMALVGATNVCLRKYDAATIFAAIRKHDVTHLCGAPVVLNMLCNLTGVKPLEKPVHIMTAASPPPAAVVLKTESLGFIVSHGYGLTETAGVVSSCSWKKKWDELPAAERARLKARQGVAMPVMAELDVIEAESGKSVQRDGKSFGEIVVRGPTVFLGYLKDPESTSKCMKNGWFYTGDIGVVHSDGYMEIKGRSKDIIISGGENVSSVEVESVLYGHLAVREAAVVARPHEFWGETPCAFVSLKKGVKEKVTEKDIIMYCRERMPHYMVPKTVVFKDDLPKTATGKILKFLLADMVKAMPIE